MREQRDKGEDREGWEEGQKGRSILFRAVRGEASQGVRVILVAGVTKGYVEWGEG